MKRFGGSRKGWLVECFFPTAEDLGAVLGDLRPKLIITNTRVPMDYTSTPLDQWLRAYKRYVARVVSGQPVTWRLSSPLHISLTDPSVRIAEIPVQGQPFKLLEPRRPVIEFAPQLLYWEKGRLSLAVYNLDDAAAFGLRVSFDRVYGTEADRWETARPTARHANYALFQALCRGLRDRSRPCVFDYGRRVIRPRLFVSTGWGPEINRQAYLRQCRLKVKSP
jgi:hypothetical protein